MRVSFPKLSRVSNLGLGIKLAIVLATFGVLASGLTGYYSYNATRNILVKEVGRDLLLSTQVLSRRVAAATGEIARDARYMAQVPAAHRVFSASAGAMQSRFKSELANQFRTMLSVHPEYFQVRLISADRNGMELVRVDRDGTNLRRVEGMNLQEKAHYPYVFESLKLAGGQVHYSNIFINHEAGAHAGLGKPTLQVATPLKGPDGKPMGVIVINVDLHRLFDSLKTELSSDFQLYLTNQLGDFLIHPDPAKTFGFDRGRRILVQDEFKSVEPVVEAKADNVIIQPRTTSQSSGVIGSFVRIPFGEVSDRMFVILGLAVPLGKVLEGTENVGRNTAQIVAGFSLLAILLSILVARTFIRPLDLLVRAVHRFSDTRELLPLPTQRDDEIGLLARSFSQMQEHILAHIDDVNQRKDAMEHQATHDALTGVPNRTMFYDLLQFSIASARRSGGHLALLFIDLDHFKQVNDTYGHAAGDAVLVEVVERFKRTVRENDIMARLSGDEFVVLIQLEENDLQVEVVAQKLIEAIRVPIDYRGNALGIGVSIGISVFPRDGESLEALLINADAAMYHSKRNGRNTFSFYS